MGPQGSIQTGGLKSHGIQAQSVAGGGVALGDFGTGLLGNWTLGSNGDTGDSGLVDVTVNGSVRTAGNNATGIFAQSAAGKGVAGMVSVTLTDSQILTGEILDPSLGGADLDASGNPLRGIGAVGIMAQSVGNAHNGKIVIAIDGADSVVRGGRSGFDLYGSEAPGVGVALIDGKDNTIVNHRLVTTLGGTLRVKLLEGFSPIVGDAFDLFDATTLRGLFASFDFDQAVLSDGLRWNLASLSIDGVLSVSAVPLPAGLWLLLSGLAGCVAVRRRRAPQGRLPEENGSRA